MIAPSASVTLTASSGSGEYPTSEDVVRDPRCIYTYTKKTEGYSLMDSLPYPVFILQRPLRDYLIEESLRTKLKIQHRWPSFSFSTPTDGISLNACRHAMKATTTAKDNQKTPDKMVSWASMEIASPHIEASTSSDKVKWLKKNTYIMTEAEPTDTGKLFAIYNNSDDQAVSLKSGEQRIPIKAHSGAVFTAGINGWQLVSKYTAKVTTTETNPLILDVESDDKRFGVRGEFLLTPKMVQDLCPSKNKPPICEHPEEIESLFHEMAASKAELSESLIASSYTSNHSAAIRVIVKGDDVFIYINETLDSHNPVAVSMRQYVMQAAQTAFRQKNTHIMAPGFKTQNDFSCCTLLTLTAIEAFEHTSDIDSWITKYKEVPDARMWSARPKTNRSTRNAVTLEDLNSKSDIYFLPVKELPAVLLKDSQNKRLEFTEKQNNTLVSTHPDTGADISLLDYTKLHTRTVPVEGTNTTTEVNLSATGMRYQAVLKWEKLTNKNKRDITETAVTGVTGSKMPASPVSDAREITTPYESTSNLTEPAAHSPSGVKRRATSLPLDVPTSKYHKKQTPSPSLTGAITLLGQELFPDQITRSSPVETVTAAHQTIKSLKQELEELKARVTQIEQSSISRAEWNQLKEDVAKLKS